jgi:hypothetical protein
VTKVIMSLMIVIVAAGALDSPPWLSASLLMLLMALAMVNNNFGINAAAPAAADAAIAAAQQAAQQAAGQLPPAAGVSTDVCDWGVRLLEARVSTQPNAWLQVQVGVPPPSLALCLVVAVITP